MFNRRNPYSSIIKQRREIDKRKVKLIIYTFIILTAVLIKLISTLIR